MRTCFRPPDWTKLHAYGRATLTAEERHFLEHDVEHLCELVNDWETQQQLDLPPQAWAYMKSQGFLGMIIPKQYGGKQFSAYMHSQVVMKLSSRCSALAVSVMVPNSLGPAELLLHYGTDAQKDYYLPRLAAGTEIPCFALTSPYAGSDAAAIPDLGVVCMGMHEGRATLGFRLSWNKRYITLAPVATLLGLAFQTSDPEHLLSDNDAPGISCALIPASHDGVVIGRRHHPLNAAFQNGPTSGNDVFIPIDWVIGGQAQVGKGWRMLMECLAAGRAISLPSSSVGMGKMAVRGTSAYAAVRRQFNMPIGKFEGVQEALARMGGNLYLMDAARTLAAHAVDLGENRPSFRHRQIPRHGAGPRARQRRHGYSRRQGHLRGPEQFPRQQLPANPHRASSVEGANILTRSLIIFGQGAIRAHPYVLREMAAVQENDGRKAVRDFDAAFFGHVGFVLGNLARGLWYGLGGTRLAAAPDIGAPALAPYYRALTRLSTAFCRHDGYVDVRARWRTQAPRTAVRAPGRRAGAAVPGVVRAEALRGRWPARGRPALCALVAARCAGQGAAGLDGRAGQFPRTARWPCCCARCCSRLACRTVRRPTNSAVKWRWPCKRRAPTANACWPTAMWPTTRLIPWPAPSGH